MSDKIYTEDGITFRAPVRAGAMQSVGVWAAVLEGRVKMLARRVAELEAENRRLAALLEEAEKKAGTTPGRLILGMETK